jgi:hypothetical protein
MLAVAAAVGGGVVLLFSILIKFMMTRLVQLENCQQL